MSEKLIKIHNLKKAYNLGNDNEFVALKGVCLEISRGEFVAIMGPSGSGKSTLMQIIGALDKATSGQYILHDQDIEEYSEDELSKFRNADIGFVFQQFNLLQKYSILDNVLLPTIYGRIVGNDRQTISPKERAIELLQKVGLGNKINSKPNQISGGQVQRVAIARSLMMNPSIILADEPTGNLDSKTGQEIMEIFKKLNQEGHTIILITHEEDIAESADRIIFIKDGLMISDHTRSAQLNNQLINTYEHF